MIYFRFLRTIAAATIAMMTTTAAIATYKVIGVCAVGAGAVVGDSVTTGAGVLVVVGDGVVGDDVGDDTGDAVGTEACEGVDVGTTEAAGASETPMDVVAYDGQYALVPSNEAVTVYSPGTGGVYIMWYKPLMSVVTVPIS